MKNQKNKSKTIITTSFLKTQQFGDYFGKDLVGGNIVALHGDLGSGKTTFVQGLAKGFGIKNRIISPTFPIIRRYEMRGGVFFYHIDLYRVESEQDVIELGLAELMDDPNAIIVIEWPEKIENLLSKNTINIHFEYIDETTRKIVIR